MPPVCRKGLNSYFCCLVIDSFCFHTYPCFCPHVRANTRKSSRAPSQCRGQRRLLYLVPRLLSTPCAPLISPVSPTFFTPASVTILISLEIPKCNSCPRTHLIVHVASTISTSERICGQIVLILAPTRHPPNVNITPLSKMPEAFAGGCLRKKTLWKS